MKRCIREHTVDAFGVIPVGSLWEDDSPYLVDESAFVDVTAPLAVDDDEPLRPVKKSAAKSVKES